jgi:hypothetical protein
MVGAALAALVARLKAAGFGSVSVDPSELNPSPVAIWLQPRTVTDLTLAGGGTLTAWCYLIGPNLDTRQVMTLLDDALSGVLELDDVSLSSDDDAVDLAAAVLLPNNTAPLPAYRLALDLDL